MTALAPISLREVEAARRAVAEHAIRTPLVRLDAPGVEHVWLKLESLQPIGSFKVRGAANAMAPPTSLGSNGVYTASAGNMAQGVALVAKRRGMPCRVIVPDSAPRAKLEAIERLGAVAVPVPYAEWWKVLEAHGDPGEAGHFIHPVSDRAVICGNGTIGLEILEDLPEVEVIVAPYGGGGLSCGIASAAKATRPDLVVLASEVETAAPLTASLAAGEPVAIDRRTTFVDGIGGGSVLPEMWPLAREVLDGARAVSISEVCEAIRLLAVHKVVAEGAAGSALAVALRPELRGRKTVVVVSGGNIDTDVLVRILRGENPTS